MRLPIFSYGHRVLRQKCEDISKDYPNLDNLIDDMWETMDKANGSGLAAPQIGRPVRLFIVNSKSTYDILDHEGQDFYFDQGDSGIMETFINAKIIDCSGRIWEDREGCLSIPNMTQTVKRSWTVTIEYVNRDFEIQIRTFSGYTARTIQHEYDHTEGLLYIDHLNSLTRKLINGKLEKISKGKIPSTYLMVYKNSAGSSRLDQRSRS